MKHILAPIAIIITLVSASLTGRQANAARPTQKISVERPDMDAIKRDISDPESKYYYPRLMERYEQNETIMNLQDYRHLYLGAIFQEDYDPYRHSPLDSKIDELYYRTNHTRAELDTIIAYAEDALLDDPFDLSQMNFLIYALRARGKNNRANIIQYRLNHLLEAILSTGTGMDTENAWVVIDPKHEYNIINFQGEIAESSEFVEPYYEYIALKPNDSKTSDKRPAGYYFNIHYILQEYYRKHPDQK